MMTQVSETDNRRTRKANDGGDEPVGHVVNKHGTTTTTGSGHTVIVLFFLSTMKSFLLSLILALICLTGSTSAFAVRPAVVSSISSSQSSTSLNVFGNRKTKEQKEADAEREAQYWQGEWVCKDCGYIYNRVRTTAPRNFIAVDILLEWLCF